MENAAGGDRQLGRASDTLEPELEVLFSTVALSGTHDGITGGVGCRSS